VSDKIRVGVLLGGQSAEHEIALMSAKSVMDALDKGKYEIIPIGITKAGEWFLYEDPDQCLLNADNPKLIALKPVQESVVLVTHQAGSFLTSLSGRSFNQPIDVVFPILHGPYGEDGTIQGLLKLANVPFVGSDVLASAACMDKAIMKQLLRDSGISIAKFLTVTQHSRDNNGLGRADALNFKRICEILGLPLFVKPANLGSSIGISKIHSELEFHEKVALAFQYDSKVILEEAIAGREIECSILGNEAPIASLPAEIIPQHEFYSYEAKYLDKKGALFEIPARLPDEWIQNVQTIAIQAFTVLGCEGMARVDVFLKENGEVILNEVNTIPGFTSISMYPKMWAASGLPYSDLIDRLIELALARFKQAQTLATTRLSRVGGSA